MSGRRRDIPAALRLGLASVSCLVGEGHAWAADPDALWKIVSGACIPHQIDGHGGKPCAEVDLTDGWAVLKDLVGATQFLLIPTARVTGIESPEILGPGARRYWSGAWAARRFVAERAGRPLARDEIGMAINAITAQSQNQLHIQVDCMRADVRSALRDSLRGVGDAWSPLSVAFNGHAYLARRLTGAELDRADPVHLLAAGVAQAGADMAHETLVATGAAFTDGVEGFVLLADRADAAARDRGSGEELLDHGCALAHPAPG